MTTQKYREDSRHLLVQARSELDAGAGLAMLLA